ncbi:Alpha/beta hydrolase fold-1 [Trichoderma chlorosporum]
MLPTVVGVTGMWHPASCFDDLAVAFRKKGYPFVSQDAPGIFTEDPINSTVDMDAEYLRQNTLLPLLAEGKKVILLMHSYGGVYGSAAVHGLSERERKQANQKGGVVGLIYVTAVTPAIGKSLLDMMGLTPENLPPHVVLDKEKGQIMLIEAEKYMYHDIPELVADTWIAKIKPQAFGCVNTAISYSPLVDSNYEGLSGYIICGNDRVLPQEAQQYYASISDIKNTVLVEAASHAFFVDTCNEVVAATISLLESISQASF